MAQAGEAGPSLWKLTPDEFEAVRQTARSLIGLDLKPGKEALICARLGRRLQTLGLKSIGEYLKHLKRDKTGAELSVFIDSLATNYTSFLREPEHFRLLRIDILPQLSRRHSLAIWSAGCATGEEPYSILFHLVEHYGERDLARCSVLATDVSMRALEQARAGIYPGARLKDLPPDWVRKYFQCGRGAREGEFRVKERFRACVRFEQVNLMEPFAHAGTFPVIFCRNVMIYFDQPTQERLVRKLADRLEPGGWLLTGHSESLMGISHGLRYVAPSVYRKPGSGRGGGI